MGSGKSLEILRVAYNYIERSQNILLLTSSLDNRCDVSKKIKSRVGIEMDALSIDNDTNIMDVFINNNLAVQALKLGTIDVVLGDFAVLSEVKEIDSELLNILDVFNKEEYGIPLQNGFDLLRLRINTILDELLGENVIHPEPNVYYTESHEEWFGIEPYLDFKGEISYFTISASSGENGNISPEGEISVREGDDIFFNFTSDDHYLIDKVIVNGTSVGNPSNFTFNDVDSDHTIEVEFTEKPFNIPGYSIIPFIIISYAIVSIIAVKIYHRRLN